MPFTDSSSEDDEDDSVLKRAGRLLSGKADYLPSGILDITRNKDANVEKPSNVSLKYEHQHRLYCSEQIHTCKLYSHFYRQVHVISFTN